MPYQVYRFIEGCTWQPSFFYTFNVMEKGKSRERLIELDAARGLALAGILAINLYIFNAPYA
jgi:hypothetical protein